MPATITASRAQSADGILDAIGQTPLVRFRRYLTDSSTRLFAKLEALNPGGSAKDRPARQMLQHALAAGDLTPGATVIESTSGNMGIGLAQACRYFGLNLICVVDPNAQPQNLQIMQALGATIDRVTDTVNGNFLSARLQRVAELLTSTPGSFWPNQYENLQNPQSHFEGTVAEIDEALHGEFDVLFVATSSTGTAQGCRDYLRRHGRDVRVIAVDAEGSALFGGTSGPRRIPGLGAGQEPGLAVNQRFDDVVRVNDLDCVLGCRRAAAREATLVGGSAGGVLEAIRRLEAELVGQRCVAVLHDSGTRYLDTVFNDDWVTSELDIGPVEFEERLNDALI